jgi:RNA polymerase sigma-70 factor (ECF subfamily)
MHSVGSLHPVGQSEKHIRSDDDALVTAAQSGSESAFRELCRRNTTRVFRSILRVTRNQADAEDALQDSFMRAFVHIRKFNKKSSFSSWLTRIGINSALMILRKKRRTCETSLDFADSDETARQWDVVDMASNPEESCLFNEMTRAIDRAVCGLPLRLRAVTELRLSQHLALHEIADVLDISIPAAKSRLFRAKRRISGILYNTTQREIDVN